MKILIIDDLRDISQAIEIASERDSKFSQMHYRNSVFTLVRTFQKAKEMFLENDTFDFLLLDHDLGSEDVYEDGNKLMGILEERYFLEGFRKFSRIIPISSNPVGIKVINQISERICKK